MKKLYLLLILTAFAACTSVKSIERSLNTGDYNKTFDQLVGKFQKGLNDKNYQKYILLFQDAYLKMVQTEEEKISRWNMEPTLNNAQAIYQTLLNLDSRQSQLKPLLPLSLNGKQLSFPTKNYTTAILDAKNSYVKMMYDNGLALLGSGNKSKIRDAYNQLKQVNTLSPGYGNVNQLLDEAHFQGIDFVLVNIENKSQQIIPAMLEQELLKINASGLNDFWTVFHQNRQQDINYQYLVQFNIQNIQVSPERMNSETLNFEKEIKDGWEYLIRDGVKMLDSLGNPIKVDKYKTVYAKLRVTTQEKDALVQGVVNLVNLGNNQILDYERLNSQFGFRNQFAEYQGDQRALGREELELLKGRMMPFPSHEQMVFDCGEDLKIQVKRLLARKF